MISAESLHPTRIVSFRAGDMEHGIVERRGVLSGPRLGSHGQPGFGVPGSSRAHRAAVITDMAQAPCGANALAGAIGPAVDLRIVRVWASCAKASRCPRPSRRHRLPDVRCRPESRRSPADGCGDIGDGRHGSIRAAPRLGDGADPLDRRGEQASTPLRPPRRVALRSLRLGRLPVCTDLSHWPHNLDLAGRLGPLRARSCLAIAGSRAGATRAVRDDGRRQRRRARRGGPLVLAR